MRLSIRGHARLHAAQLFAETDQQVRSRPSRPIGSPIRQHNGVSDCRDICSARPDQPHQPRPTVGPAGAAVARYFGPAVAERPAARPSRPRPPPCRAKAQAAPRVSPSPACTVSPTCPSLCCRSSSIAASPPARCAAPVMSMTSPSSPSNPTQGQYRTAQRRSPNRNRRSASGSAGRLCRSGQKARASENPMPRCSPRRSASAFRQWIRLAFSHFSVSAKGPSTGARKTRSRA